MLSSLNEAVLLGFGRPAYGSAANAVRFVALATGLPLAYAAVGLTGAVAAISASEVIRYFAVAVGQRRLGHGFWGQDAAATALTVLVMLGWVLARDGLSLGLPWSGIIHAPAP